MQAYSIDLRERVVQAYEEGKGTISDIARMFSVGETFVKKMLRQKRQIGSLERLPPGSGAKRKLSASEQKWLSRQIKKQADATLEELQERLFGEKGKRISKATLCRRLQEMKLVRKKRL